MIVSRRQILYIYIKKIAYSQWHCLSFMILNVNTYANVVFERSLRTKEGCIDVKESLLTIMKKFRHKWIHIFCKWIAKGVLYEEKREYLQKQNFRNGYEVFSHLFPWNSHPPLICCFVGKSNQQHASSPSKSSSGILDHIRCCSWGYGPYWQLCHLMMQSSDIYTQSWTYQSIIVQ